jgi:hypothetical protein
MLIDVENNSVAVKNVERIVDTTLYEAEPPFVKLYLDTVSYLMDVPKGCSNVLYELLRYIPYTNEGEDPYFAINSSIKRIIASKLGCSMSKVEHALTDFVGKKILFRVDTGLYLFNPELFGRGEWKHIKQLRLSVVYNNNGKKVRGYVDK